MKRRSEEFDPHSLKAINIKRLEFLDYIFYGVVTENVQIELNKLDSKEVK